VGAENLTKISSEHLGLSSPQISCSGTLINPLSEIHEVPLHEKLRMMEAVWDGIAPLEAEMEVPQWHKDLLDEREQLIQEGKAKFIDWEIAKLQIKDAIS
jgi:Mlc titration factor MtfA (ptsG expression regulator)